MLIDAAHPEETRVVVLSGHRLEEFDFETSTKKQIKGNIYLAKITRVEPSLQAAFVEYGGNRHGFLAFNEIHPDYYRIPVGDRRAAEARAARERELVEESRAAEDDHQPEPLLPREPQVPDEPPHDDEGASDEPSLHDELLDGEPEEAMAATAGGADVLYDHPEAEDDRGGAEDDRGGDDDDRESAAYDRRTDIDHRADEGEAAGAYPDEPPLPAEPVAGGEEPSAGAAPADAPVVPADAHEEAPQEAESTGGVAEVVGEESRSEAAQAIETVGGDEIEEAPRQRVRPFRHYKIQEVIKRRQIMLVQVTKEERGNKGAALTTFLSLAGRYCVLMPNTPRGGGVSRKITNALDRRRLKDLMSDLDVPDGMGVIVRTAGSERSRTEIKRDFEYLLRLWDEIRDLTLKSTAPALIYEEGNLIKRSIRDLYTRDLEEVVIDGEEGYRTAKAFMKMLMPSHAKRIKPYRDASIPLFHRFQVESQIDAIHSPVVQLRSGGYIVINPTEALVSIDVNSGRSTRERNIEETALKTNVEAAEEIARQLRLRDLAGLIVIDFIDMEEHRNQATVERRLKEAMRHDRARIQLGRISPFGLLEMSRQRLRPSLLEASTQPCPHCNGSGHIRSTESTALHVLRAIEEEGMRRRTAEISVAVPGAVALYILNQKRDALVHAEALYGFRVTVSSDDALIPPAFRLERLRALTPAEIAALPEPVAPPAEPEDEDEDLAIEDEAMAAEAADGGEAAARAEAGEEIEMPSLPSVGEHARAERGDGDGQGRRRRRRRRRGRREEGRETPHADALPREGMPMMPPPLQDVTAPIMDMADEEGEENAPELAHYAGEAAQPAPRGEPGGNDGARKRRRRGRRGGRRRRRGEGGQEGAPVAGERTEPAAEEVEYVPPLPEDLADDIAASFETAPEAIAEPDPPGVESVPVAEPVPELVAPAPPPAPVAAAAAPPDEPEPPRHATSTPLPTHEVSGPTANPKRGWWRRG
jgi:ribonuclease E